MTPSGITPCPTGVTVREFGVHKTEALLTAVVDAVHRAAMSPRPEAVHQMRVAIRRFQQSIRTFKQFLRKKGIDIVRGELRSLMEAAGELRNLDIACSLVKRSGGDPAVLRERREGLRAAFQERLVSMDQPNLKQNWLRELGLVNEQAKQKEKEQTETLES